MTTTTREYVVPPARSGCPTWCDGSHNVVLDDGVPNHSVTRWVASGMPGWHDVQVRLTRAGDDLEVVLNVGAEAYLTTGQGAELVRQIHELVDLTVEPLPVPWVRTTESAGPLDGCPDWCDDHTMIEEEFEPEPTRVHVRRFSGPELPLGAVAVERYDSGAGPGGSWSDVNIAVQEAEHLTAQDCRNLAAALLEAAAWAEVHQ